MTNEQLFKQAFDDSDSFVDFYFNKRRNKVKIFDNLNTKSDIISNELIAQIGVLDINIACNDKSYKCALLTGVCVEESHQNQGVMKKLFTNILNKLKQAKYDFALLSPDDDRYYLKYGFSPAMIGDFIKCNYQEDKTIIALEATSNDFDLLLKLYDKTSKSFDIYQKLSINDIKDIFDEYNLNNDKLLIVCKNDLPVGWIAIEGSKITHTILPDLKLLSNVKQAESKNYFYKNQNGKKQLFQAAPLCSPLPDFKNSTILLINKY